MFLPGTLKTFKKPKRVVAQRNLKHNLLILLKWCHRIWRTLRTLKKLYLNAIQIEGRG